MQIIYYPLPDSPFLSPEEVVNSFDLKNGEKALDFGAGSGYWAIPLARAVGREGHVFVTDTKKENLSVIKAKAEKAGLDNISYYEFVINESLSPVQTKVDLILVSNVISDSVDFEEILKEVKKLAKIGTKLIIIEWKKDAVIGPKKENRIDPESVILKAAKSGFQFKKLLSAGAHHTGFFFVYEK